MKRCPYAVRVIIGHGGLFLHHARKRVITEPSYDRLSQRQHHACGRHLDRQSVHGEPSCAKESKRQSFIYLKTQEERGKYSQPHGNMTINREFILVSVSLDDPNSTSCRPFQKTGRPTVHLTHGKVLNVVPLTSRLKEEEKERKSGCMCYFCWASHGEWTNNLFQLKRAVATEEGAVLHRITSSFETGPPGMADCDSEETGPFRNNWCGLAAERGVEGFVGLTTSESRRFHGCSGGGGGGKEGGGQGH
ncbi:unnamed protein product [Pleuronectes platessa]|uniref:Uncharacterized protein n=1 Tax=Pleuronectes platessa TaxID=8262 RepID=A0A9N7Y8P9_PLEPL|nr:unnamed protein product [Pleuronectes platessa]